MTGGLTTRLLASTPAAVRALPSAGPESPEAMLAAAPPPGSAVTATTSAAVTTGGDGVTLTFAALDRALAAAGVRSVEATEPAAATLLPRPEIVSAREVARSARRAPGASVTLAVACTEGDRVATTAVRRAAVCPGVMAPERASVDVTGKSVTNTDTADAETPVALATPAVNAARLKVPGSMERVSAAAT
jgi:hypothetical protein